MGFIISLNKKINEKVKVKKPLGRESIKHETSPDKQMQRLLQHETSPGKQMQRLLQHEANI